MRLLTLVVLGMLRHLAEGVVGAICLPAKSFQLAKQVRSRIVPPSPVRKHWLVAPIAVAAAWGPMQMAAGATSYSFATLEKSLEWGMCLVTFLLGLQIMARKRHRRLFIEVLVWFGFGLSTISVLQFVTSEGKIFWLFPNGYLPMVLGPFVNRDHFSSFVELLLPVAMYKLRTSPHVGMGATMAGMMYIAGVVGGSRAGAVITTLLAIAAIFILSRQHPRSRRLAKSVLLVALAMVFATVIGYDRTWERFNLPNLFAGRYELNLASVSMISERPWSGFGLGTWPHVYPAHAVASLGVFANAAHNDWAQWAVEGGIGFAILMLVIGVWSTLRAYHCVWALGIPGVLLHGTVDFPLQIPALQLWFFAILAALASERPAGVGPRLVFGRRLRTWRRAILDPITTAAYRKMNTC